MNRLLSFGQKEEQSLEGSERRLARGVAVFLATLFEVFGEPVVRERVLVQASHDAQALHSGAPVGQPLASTTGSLDARRLVLL